MTIKKQIPTIPISVAPFNEGVMVGMPKALKAMWTNLSKGQLHLIYFFRWIRPLRFRDRARSSVDLEVGRLTPLLTSCCVRANVKNAPIGAFFIGFGSFLGKKDAFLVKCASFPRWKFGAPAEASRARRQGRDRRGGRPAPGRCSARGSGSGRKFHTPVRTPNRR